ncbi:MAG: double zinc ribbon domain-containing protein [Bacillota bacterium]
MSEKGVSRVLQLLAWAFLFYIAWAFLFGGLGLGMGLGIGILTIGAIVTILIKLLFVFFVFALAVSIFQLTKKVLAPETDRTLKDYSEPVVSKVKEQYRVFANKVECPGCHKIVNNTYQYCPHCAAQLKQTCDRCGTIIEPGWKCCPFCGPEEK